MLQLCWLTDNWCFNYFEAKLILNNLWTCKICTKSTKFSHHPFPNQVVKVPLSPSSLIIELCKHWPYMSQNFVRRPHCRLSDNSFIIYLTYIFMPLGMLGLLCWPSPNNQFSTAHHLTGIKQKFSFMCWPLTSRNFYDAQYFFDELKQDSW